MKKEFSSNKNVKQLLTVLAVVLVLFSPGMILSSHNILLIFCIMWLMLSWGYYQAHHISKANVFMRMGTVCLLLIALYAMVDAQMLNSVHRIGNFMISLNVVLRFQLALAFGYYLLGCEGWMFAPGGLFYRRS